MQRLLLVILALATFKGVRRHIKGRAFLAVIQKRS
jgi:hypothetical protein